MKPWSRFLASALAAAVAAAPIRAATDADQDSLLPEGIRVTPAGLQAFLKSLRQEPLQSTEKTYREIAEALAKIDPKAAVNVSDANSKALLLKLRDMYSAGGYEAVKALAKDGTIKPRQSEAIATLRNAMVEATMAQMTMRYGEIRVNDFSTAPTAQSDIDQTLHPVLEIGPDGKERIAMDPAKPGQPLTGAYLKEQFRREFKDLFGIEPERMEVATHPAEATVPDWRQHPDIDEFAARLDKGLTLLGANPEAYFLEGAFRRQVDRRSFESDKPLFRIFRPLRKKAPAVHVLRLRHSIGVDRKLARDEVYKNVPPEWRKGYAFGATVGNLLFFEHHRAPEDVPERAKYLMRSMEDGMASLLVSPEGEGRLYFDVKDPGERMKMLQGAYPDAPPERLKALYDLYDTAEQLRLRRTELSSAEVRRQIYGPLMLEILAREHADPKTVLATFGEEALNGLLRDAEKLFRDRSHAIMVENAVRAAGPRIKDWLDPQKVDASKIPEQHREAFLKNPETFHDNLRLAAKSELLAAFAHLDPSIVDRIVAAETDPLFKRALMDVRDLARVRRSLLTQFDKGADYYRQVVEDLRAIGDKFARVKTEFSEIWNDGRYTAPEKYTRMKALVFESLGYRHQAELDRLVKSAETGDGRWDAGRIASHVFNLGNVDSVIQIVRAGQESGWQWSSVAWAAGFEVISNLKGVSPALAVYGALFEGQVEGAAVLAAGYFFPVVGQVYMVYNIRKGAMEVVDFDITQGVSDLVYQGYEPEATGGFWGFMSYLRPSAYLNNIATLTAMKQPNTVLYFVPGRTFREQRVNLFSYYDRDVMKGIETQGMEEEALARRRKERADAFFMKLVHDYADQRGAFAEIVLPGGSKFKEYLNRPTVREGIRDRLVKDYLGGLAKDKLSGYQDRELPELERGADEAAELLARAEDGLGSMGKEVRPLMHLVSGLPPFNDPDPAAVEKTLTVDRTSEPVVTIEAPSGVLTPGDAAAIKGRCAAPPGRFRKPYVYTWRVVGLSAQDENKEAFKGLTFRQGWTEEKSVKIEVEVHDADKQFIGKAEETLRFGDLPAGSTGALGAFTLLKCTVKYYTAQGKKKGDRLDVVSVRTWLPVLVNGERPLTQAIAETTEELKSRHGGAADPDLTSWLAVGGSGWKAFAWSAEEADKRIPTPFAPGDIPEKQTSVEEGAGPVWP